MPALLPFAKTKDYDDYAKRLRNFPKQVDDTIANMRKGMGDRLMPPKFLLEKVVEQANRIASQEAEKTPFAQPLEKFADGVPEADRGRLRAEIVEAIRAAVIPAYKRFGAFVRDEYAPRGRKEVGLWSLPDGAKVFQGVKRSRAVARGVEQVGHDHVVVDAGRADMTARVGDGEL